MQVWTSSGLYETSPKRYVVASFFFFGITIVCISMCNEDVMIAVVIAISFVCPQFT